MTFHQEFFGDYQDLGFQVIDIDIAVPYVPFAQVRWTASR